MMRDRKEAAPGAAFFSPAEAGATPPFSVCVREHTRDLHREAERTGFVRDMLAGRIDRLHYLLWLRNLHAVYDALEQALRSPDGMARAAPFTDPRLCRTQPLAEDLVTLAGADWDRLPRVPETDGYVDVIGAARLSWRLMGHAYTRYLGDLSGGQLLSGLMAKHLGLPADALRYYGFSGIPDIPSYRTTLRDRMDAVLHDDESAMRDALQGAAEGFEQSIALSRAIGTATV